MRRLFIAGNWKMNKDLRGALDLVTALKEEVGDGGDVDVGVFPPFVYLQAVARTLADSPIVVGAQNMHAEPSGAFTGETAGPMILDAGATHVLIGHSERRQYFGETDEGVNTKLKAALGCGLKPVVCVGETLDQREAGDTEAVVRRQVDAALDGLTDDQAADLLLAYEPVWAIGTGKTATPGQAQEVHAFIRSTLAHRFTPAVADGIRIQYGGSVKPDNAADLLGQEDIDGALVGGASLEAETFIPILRARER
ncbi:MAG: triose-phosphate isomerase [Planctomycetota bacterium]